MLNLKPGQTYYFVSRTAGIHRGKFSDFKDEKLIFVNVFMFNRYRKKWCIFDYSRMEIEMSKIAHISRNKKSVFGHLRRIKASVRRRINGKKEGSAQKRGT